MATLYFTGAVNNEWTEPGNWFDESNNPASSLPTSSDSVIATASILSNSGSAPTIVNFTLQGYDSILSSYLNVTGTATFKNNSYNNGTISGDCIFQDKSYNLGTVDGNATFKNRSDNRAGITGNVTFITDIVYVNSSSLLGL